MAVPKRRTSKARKRKRRAHLALSLPPGSSCVRCGAEKVPHAVCGNCGHYGGRDVLALDA
ncbi:MAG: 50S ribosomal protein L32 [Planctomycetes bacterium]|nr:50S ribosomal protein L32 [Planctomycetota bacterium]